MIEISADALKEAAGQGMDEFIRVFTDKYKEALGGDPSPANMQLLNGYQHSLLGYSYFREEVMNGGFIQLIQNGYGPYIFENPFAKAMRLFGMKEFSKLLYEAKIIFEAHKEDLQKDRTDEEFMALYEQYEEFDDLEEAYLEMEEQVTASLAEYVDTHLEQFARIV